MQSSLDTHISSQETLHFGASLPHLDQRGSKKAYLVLCPTSTVPPFQQAMQKTSRERPDPIVNIRYTKQTDLWPYSFRIARGPGCEVYSSRVVVSASVRLELGIFRYTVQGLSVVDYEHFRIMYHCAIQ